MIYNEKIKTFLKFLKLTSLFGGSALLVGYPIYGTYKSIRKIVNTDVLNVEKKHTPEYIYIDDPQYSITMAKERDRASKQSIGFARVWKSLKHSLEWRLLWLCKHGKPNLRDFSLEQLALFSNNKEWDCAMLAQAMDARTAVLLARTEGSDLRYFLPPPIHVRREALKQHLLYFTFHDMILALQKNTPHSCIQQFLSKYFVNLQEENTEVDTDVPKKPDSVSANQLSVMCIEAIHHHLSLYHNRNFEKDTSTKILLELGLLPKLAELLLRYPGNKEIDLAVVNVCTILSVHKHLLIDFHQNGLIRELARMIKSNDVRLSSSAAVCLANLSGESLYRPGLYLLHPIYRSRKPIVCDTMLVHGLQGGVFVTWRQRDRSCLQPIGIMEENDDRGSYTFCWPKDWLPRDCCNVRVMGINYWSSLSDWFHCCPLLTADIKRRASELLPTLQDACVGGKKQTNIPIVWLAHSMGGLITKEILIQASKKEDTQAQKICGNTKGLLFYATPHKGSALASMPRAAAAILWPSNDVQQLQSNSSTLLKLNEKFINLAEIHDWETVSFAETLPTLITAFKVPIHFVETDSADLGRGVFFKLPLDHLCICKPETRTSIIYTTVLEVVRRATANSILPDQQNPLLDFLTLRTLYQTLGRVMRIFFSEPTDEDPDGLMWIERLLLDTFTDGFHD